MKRPYLLAMLFVLLGLSLPLAADNVAGDFIHGRHSLRLGWGDAFLSSDYSFEPLYGMTPAYNFSVQPALDAIVGLPAQVADSYLRDYRFVELGELTTKGHFFLGYQYQFTPLISLGMEVDYLHMKKRTQWYNGYNTALKENPYEYLHHLTLMPTVRCTYSCQRVLSWYSALGVGYAFYGDVADGRRGNNHGIALDVTALGINLGGKYWFVEAELGSFQSWALNGSTNGLYGSRLISVAIGYRF